MTRHLTIDEVLELHRLVIAQSGGSEGMRDRGLLASAVAVPKSTFDKQELYATLAAKAAALGYSVVCNHPFVDGNKRVGHAAMETFLVLNGWELSADVEEQERVILRLAAGQMTRPELTAWVEAHLIQRVL